MLSCFSATWNVRTWPYTIIHTRIIWDTLSKERNWFELKNRPIQSLYKMELIHFWLTWCCEIFILFEDIFARDSRAIIPRSTAVLSVYYLAVCVLAITHHFEGMHDLGVSLQRTFGGQRSFTHRKRAHDALETKVRRIHMRLVCVPGSSSFAAQMAFEWLFQASRMVNIDVIAQLVHTLEKILSTSARALDRKIAIAVHDRPLLRWQPNRAGMCVLYVRPERGFIIEDSMRTREEWAHDPRLTNVIDIHVTLQCMPIHGFRFAQMTFKPFVPSFRMGNGQMVDQFVSISENIFATPTLKQEVSTVPIDVVLRVHAIDKHSFPFVNGSHVFLQHTFVIENERAQRVWAHETI